MSLASRLRAAAPPRGVEDAALAAQDGGHRQPRGVVALRRVAGVQRDDQRQLVGDAAEVGDVIRLGAGRQDQGQVRLLDVERLLQAGEGRPGVALGQVEERQALELVGDQRVALAPGLLGPHDQLLQLRAGFLVAAELAHDVGHLLVDGVGHVGAVRLLVGVAHLGEQR
jgi:hypothetical protein